MMLPLLFIVSLTALRVYSQEKAVLPYADPVDTSLCRGLPVPPTNFTNWGGQFVDSVWWEWAKRGATHARRLPKDLKSTFAGTIANSKTRCEAPKGHLIDKNRYYWQISCPYKVYWLSWFESKKYSYGKCYVIAPCIQRARIVNCTYTYCKTRCRIYRPQIRNSVCFENHYERFTIWVFCPYWKRICKTKPEKCFKKVTVYLPQYCECWSCWDMWITMPPTKTPPFIPGKL